MTAKKGRVMSVLASDILFYVDTYRRLINRSPAEVSRDKERYEEQFWNAEKGAHYYAGLRAHEHAYKTVLGDTPPGAVVFGESAETEGEGDDEQLKKRLQLQIEANLDAMRQKLQLSKKAITNLEGELVEKQQAVNRLQRRIEQIQSNYLVMIGVLSLAVVALLGILLAGG